MEQGHLYIDQSIYPTLLAISEAEQERGLMYQKYPPPVMSFIYSAPKVCKFWMKNTPSPLDILFCKSGQVIDICKGEPHSTKTIGGDYLTDLVIELPYGTAQKENIEIGSRVGLVKPTKEELKKICATKYGIFLKL